MVGLHRCFSLYHPSLPDSTAVSYLLPSYLPRRRFHRPRQQQQQQQQSVNGETKNSERDGGGGGGKGGSDIVVRAGMVIDRDPRGLGYLARFEAPQPAGFNDELVPWESVIAIK